MGERTLGSRRWLTNSVPEFARGCSICPRRRRARSRRVTARSRSARSRRSGHRVAGINSCARDNDYRLKQVDNFALPGTSPAVKFGDKQTVEKLEESRRKPARSAEGGTRTPTPLRAPAPQA